jgi:hypothetical protein
MYDNFSRDGWSEPVQTKQPNATKKGRKTRHSTRCLAYFALINPQFICIIPFDYAFPGTRRRSTSKPTSASSCSPSLFSRTAVAISFEGNVFGKMCPSNSNRSRPSQVRTRCNGHHVGGNCSFRFTGRNVAGVCPPLRSSSLCYSVA